MSKRIVTLVASLAAALVGGWLMLAPFALGYRPAGAAWNHPTEVDFWTGVGIVALALLALAGSLASVRAELRARGAIPPRLTREERQERKAAAAAAKAAAAAAKAAALADQGAAQQGTPGQGPAGQSPGLAPGAQPAPATPELRELLAPLVLALLNDLSAGSPRGGRATDPGPSDPADSGGHQAGASEPADLQAGASEPADLQAGASEPGDPQSEPSPDNGNRLSGPGSMPSSRRYS